MKKLLLIAILLLLAFTVTSCGLLSSDSEAPGDIADQQQDSGEAGFVDNSLNTPDDSGRLSDTDDTGNVQEPDESIKEGKMIKVTLYFPTIDNSALKKKEREIPVKDAAVLKACILALADGPHDSKLRNPIPEGTEIRGISIKDGTAFVDLSEQFLNSSGLDEVTSRFAIVNTLTEIEGVEKVRLWIEGNDMIGPSGRPLGDMRPVALDAEGYPIPGEIRPVTLYFSDSQAMYVVGEKRDIEVQAGVALEELVISELMAGPRTDELWEAIPDGTRLISASTKNGLCTVNFSKEFVENSPGGTASERMAIFSVVNSLTELDGIEKVQFLIEGEKREIYTHVIFSEPFLRNESVITK